ncbi:MAG TPA: glycosyltransferase family 2 protein [Bryobacterales bacterium]|nr:glycosyltransferase family 2 protein [Bryobacterales bacterium]
MDPIAVSVVIPIHNEEKNILPLYDRLIKVLEPRPGPFEIILVDDASNDGSRELLRSLTEVDSRLKVIRLRRNFGQTAALAAGFELAQGEAIVAMDGDLQHDPADIPALLDKLEEGYDIASGWRRERVDNPITRKIPSRVANWLMRHLSGVPLHDFGTTFKAYRRDTIKDIRLYGDLHRFIPALASVNGAHVAEVPIRNVVRADGNSHYGLGRTFRVLFDILTIRFLLRYFTRPMHFFGSVGLVCGGLGSVILGGLLIDKLAFSHHLMIEHGPLLIAGAMLALTGIQLFCTGLIGEVLIRTYFESQDRPIYSIREIISQDRRRAASRDERA